MQAPTFVVLFALLVAPRCARLLRRPSLLNSTLLLSFGPYTYFLRSPLLRS